MVNRKHMKYVDPHKVRNQKQPDPRKTNHRKKT